MVFEAGRGGSGLEPKLAGLRLTPADFAGHRRRTPQDLGRILAGPGTGPSGPAVPGRTRLQEGVGKELLRRERTITTPRSPEGSILPGTASHKV